MSTATLEAQGFVPVPVRGIEQELARQFQAEQDPGGPPIQRARLSNLVVYCDRAEQVEMVTAALPEIIGVHPARVLLLDVRPGHDAGAVTAAVRVRTRYVHGTQEIGSEQVTIRASGHAIDHVPNVVRGLLIGDLPTNLWWASTQPPPLAGPLLYDLAEPAQQIIYDSFAWPEPARGIAATAAWLARFERGTEQGGLYRVASDLTWRRLKPWRRTLAQALDPATAPGALTSAADVVIEHGPHSATFAWGLASWLIQGLGWHSGGARVKPGEQIDWHLTSTGGPRHLCLRRLGDRPSGIHLVRVSCAIDGVPRDLTVTPCEESRRLRIVLEGGDAAARTVTLTTPPLPELIGQQLSDRERDPVFRATMSVAQTLAQRVLDTQR
jgi:glucose-6-phosphate dehydrogenase assembly protein OpcA